MANQWKKSKNKLLIGLFRCVAYLIDKKHIADTGLNHMIILSSDLKSLRSLMLVRVMKTMNNSLKDNFSFREIITRWRC